MMITNELNVGFIGAGITGTALACGLHLHGYHVAAVSSRNISSSLRFTTMLNSCRICQTNQEVADLTNIVFITTPDDVIADIASDLHWRSGQIVMHCSGVHSTEILEPALKQGAHVCCLHPLQTFASLQNAIDSISGSTFAIEGDEQALQVARAMATDLNGNIIELKPDDKVLYHASAVIVSNYMVTLMKMASDLWQTFGISQDNAVSALLPLLQGTVHNIQRVGIPDCITGPIARGDIGTIEKHLEALEKQYPAIFAAYKAMAFNTIPVAMSKGRISLETAREIESILLGQSMPQHSNLDDIYQYFELDHSSSTPKTIDKEPAEQ